jgi:hypothetical protein
VTARITRVRSSVECLRAATRAVRAFFGKLGGGVQQAAGRALRFGLAKTTVRERWDYRVPLFAFGQVNLRAASQRAIVRHCVMA